ncbi:MAG: prepilin-type N-terminal cleavage/methylation domain-containing protein [Nitrospirae bacterium]|nr:prepilin-type N-terminal cleavage/methylation domain-containing protein [Nitrospirota bacterium]
MNIKSEVRSQKSEAGKAVFLNFKFSILNSRRAGFTLVEISIVLVIVGLLIGMGVSMLGPLTRRAKLTETRNTVKVVYETISGYAAANKRLPPNLTVLSTRTTDSYNGNLQYYFATGLDASSLCTTAPSGGTYLTVNDRGVSKSNVAFIVFSQGETLCNQTGAASPFTIVDTGTATICTGGADSPAYDDIVMYQDINTLRQQLCNSFRIVTDSLPTGTEEIAYSSTTLDATDGTPGYTWSVVGQSQGSNGCTGTDYPVAFVNTGLCLTTGGIISGTPILDGSYNFTVNVSDAEARSATKSFSITINPNDPKITTEILSYGTVGQGYTATISATGGSSSYTWGLTCPAAITSRGIICSGNTITGTPAAGAEGTHQISVTVTDSASRTASKNLSLAINPAASSASQTAYRVWNNTGSRRDFIIDSTCRRVNNNNEITTGTLQLNSGETIYRYSTNNGTCGGAVQASLSYSSAESADSNKNAQVNFTGTDR